MRSDERAIHEVHTTWVDAANAGDVLRMLKLMADDVVFLNPGQEPFGRDGFAAPLPYTENSPTAAGC